MKSLKQLQGAGPSPPAPEMRIRKLLYKYPVFIHHVAAAALDGSNARPRQTQRCQRPMESRVNTKSYIPYLTSPSGRALSGQAREAAALALEAQLGSSCQVLAAKAAFDEAGGAHALGPGPMAAVTRWTLAAQAATQAACSAEQILQTAAKDIDPPSTACLDVVATARYTYTEIEWLRAFTVHFGMSDYCNSHQEALAAGRRWLAVARAACPIAAAEQEIRNRHAQTPLSAHAANNTSPAVAGASVARPTTVKRQGAPACF